MNVKVEIFRDRMVISHNGSAKSFSPKSSFSTNRLLIGNFFPAVDCLKQGLREVGVLGFFKLSKPMLDIHPMEMTGGGLSEVEIRVLREVASGAGAKGVKIHA